MAKKDDAELLQIEGHEVRVSHPEKLYFTSEKFGLDLRKIDLVRYFLTVAPAALQAIQDRPIVLKRFVNGAAGEPFYQKRAPENLPPYLRTVTLSFPSGRTADEVVCDNPAGLAWVMNLGCMELHPHPVRTGNLDHPDELRVDLDPGPGVPWSTVREVALVVKQTLADHGLHGWPKTSGSRGIHINVRIAPRWTFTEVRRAALALSREVERRAPALATSKWWKEERHGVFLDYNQNAKDRTTCSAYSVRPVNNAQVSAPLTWDEVPSAELADFTVLTMPARYAAIGNPHVNMDAEPGSLEQLLELAARDEREGLGDAPWPPHFAKGDGEPPRVQPSKAKAFSDQIGEGFGEKRFRKRSAAKSTTVPGAPGSGSPLVEPDRRGEDLASETWDIGALSAPASTPPKAIPKTRASKFPLIVIAQSPDKAAALAGLDRWKQAHPEAATLLAEDDILIDRMRGSAYIWYRIRLNLRHIPEPERPSQGPIDPNEDPTQP